MDSLRVDSLIVALQRNTASVDAANDVILYALGFGLGLLFVRAVYYLWFR